MKSPFAAWILVILATPVIAAPTLAPADARLKTTTAKTAPQVLQRKTQSAGKGAALQPVPTDRLVGTARYQRQLRAKALLPIDVNSRRQGEVARKQATAEAETYLRKRLAKHPALLRQALAQPDPRASKRLPNGNLETRLRSNRGLQKRVLLGRDFALRTLARSAADASKPTARAAVYKALHAEMARSVKSGKISSRLLSRYPQVSSKGDIVRRGKLVGTRDFNSSLQAMIRFWRTRPAEPEEPQGPFMPTVRCDQEEYFGDGTDGASGGWPSFHAQGLYANNDWPLKPHTTCVKDQGQRGTCVAFSLTAAVESRVSVQANRKVNLSEQELYNTEKMSPLSLPPNCGDGLMPVFELFGLTVSGYEFTGERRWDYNPSTSRDDAPFLSAECYVDSCVGYSGGACSNSNHQGRRVCGDGLFAGVCGYEDPVQGTTDIQFDTATGIFNLFDREGSLNEAIALLNAKVPVVLSFAVHQTFDQTPSTGYTAMPVGDDPMRGYHAALLVGWVSNSERPSGVAAGAGGGYFVLKNSWGRDQADGGFYYLPFDYVRDTMTGLDAINSVKL